MRTLIENDDMNENANAIVVQKCITFFLPPFFQSAKNPQKNELMTTPVKNDEKSRVKSRLS